MIIDEIVYGQNIERIIFFVLVEAVIVIATNALSRVSLYLNQKLNYNYELLTTKYLINKYNSLSLRQIENSDIKCKFYLAKNESHDGSSIIDGLLRIFESAFSIVLLSAAVVTYNPIAILAFIGTAFLIFLSETHFYSYIYKLQRAWIPERRKADYYCDILTEDASFKETRLYRSQSFFTNLFYEKKHKFQQQNLKISKKRQIVNISLYIVNIAVYYIIYILFIKDVLSGIITIGTLTYISGILHNLRSGINDFFNTLAWLNDRTSYLGDFFAFFDLEPDLKIRGTHNMEVKEEGLVFSHVGYKYENKTNWAVFDLNFQIKNGDKVLIFGLNGSGKSTVIKLICKLYTPTTGDIYLNGRNIHTIDDEEYYREVGAIFQDYIKYEMSVAENIGIGNIRYIDDITAIQQCAKKTRINDLIESLPNKYKQQLGKYFSGGVQLSGGEWQKIAIARALYGSRSWILLDEPSAALDIMSERQLYQDLLNDSKDVHKTIVIVSHRLNNLKGINHVIVLKKGTLLRDEILNEPLQNSDFIDSLLALDVINNEN